MDDKMASGRMLKKEISDSDKLGNVKNDRARVLYFMMLPHLDVKGRLEADTLRIKGQIVTMLQYSEKSIQTSLQQLHDAHLITLYVISNKQYLEYTRFEDFQNLNPHREAKSTIPSSTQENSGVIKRTPIKLSLNKGKLSKGNLAPPTLAEVQQYAKEKGLQLDCKKFIDYFTEGGWVDSRGRRVKNWKLKAITWSNHNESRTQNNRTHSTADQQALRDQESAYGQSV